MGVHIDRVCGSPAYVCKRRDQRGAFADPEGMAQCLRGKRHAERQYSESVTYKCWKGKAELEDNIDGSKSIKKLIIE